MNIKIFVFAKPAAEAGGGLRIIPDEIKAMLLDCGLIGIDGRVPGRAKVKFKPVIKHKSGAALVAYIPLSAPF
jgi:hypothetical protein